MTLLAQYSTLDEAIIVKGMLATHGIKAEIITNAMSSVFPAPGAGTTSVSLYVDAADEKAALDLLREHSDLD